MSFDCIVCGECCVDLSLRPIPLDIALGEERLYRTAPIQLGSGGIVSNAGQVMAALGLNVSACACIGQDSWGDHLLQTFRQAGIHIELVERIAGESTSTTAVLIDSSGEQVFAYHGGASIQLDRERILARLDQFAQSKVALFGYYGLFGSLESDLPECLAAIRETGCMTAMDAAGDGGGITPLDRILPHLDMYFPSEREGLAQTGESDPRRMIEKLRQFNSDAIIGIKLGERGAVLSPAEGEWLDVPGIPAPGEVVDTTGAGDSFVAGFIAGKVRDYSIHDAARLAAATGASSVTAVGAVAGIGGLDAIRTLAGLD